MQANIVEADARPGPAVSVVIATLGRPEKLGRSLAAFDELNPETAPFEVIVVLDGADEATRAAARAPHRFALRVLEQPRRGTGPAKNLGAGAARAPYLLFLNDDTRPDPDCLRAHLRAQAREGPCVAVGGVEWDRAHEVTPYMAWLAPAGHLFNFARLQPHALAHWDACWGAHVGLPLAWHREQPFDPGFPYASLEDTEWGYRLARQGRPIRYVPEALCFHDHRYDGPADFRRRARISGAAARYTVRRHPSLAGRLLVHPLAVAVAATLLGLWPRRWRRETAWDLDFRWNLVWGTVTRQRRHSLRHGAP